MSSSSLPAAPSLDDAPRRRRRWMVIALALALAGGLAVVGVHVPFARTHVLSWAAAQLLRQNIRFEAGRFEYNLLTLSATIEDVRLSSTESTRPFFEATAVRVNLPWSILRGGVTLESLDVERPVVTFVREADGSINWPDFGSDDSTGGFNGPAHIDRLRVSDLTIRFDDAVTDQHIEARGLALVMQRAGDAPLAGTLWMTGPATLRAGPHQSTLTALAGGVRFDGVTVSLTDLAVATPEAQLDVRGTIDLLGATPQLALQYSLGFDTEPIAAWLGLAPAPSGRLQVDGSAEGPRSSPTFTAAVTTRRLAWAGLDAMTIDGRAGLSGSTITLDGLNIGVAGGSATVDGRVELDINQTSAFNARFRNLGLTEMSVLFPQLTRRPGATADGTLSVSWSGSVLDADGRLTSTLRATAPRLDVVPVAGPVDITFGERRWTLVASSRVAGTFNVQTRATGHIDADMADTPLSGTMTGEAPDVAAAVRQLAIVGITPDWDDADPVQGVLSAALSVGGTFGNPSVTGSVAGRKVTIAGAGPSILTSDLDADFRIATFRNVTLTSGVNIVNGGATVGIDANTLEGTFNGSLPDLAAFGAALPEAWRPAGAASVSAVLSGAPDAPVVTMQLTSPGLVAGGQTIDRATSTATLADDVLTVTSFELTRGAGRLSASGRYGLADGAYAVQATGTDLVLDPVPSPAADGSVASILPIHARFDLTFQGEGTLEVPGGTGQLRFSNLAWETYELGSSVADIVLSNRTARIHVDLPSVGGIADATIGTSSGAVTATIAVTDAELAALIRAEGPAGWVHDAADDAAGSEVEAVTGTVTLRATAEGVLDNLAAASVVVDADLSNAHFNGVPVVATQPARVRHTNGLFEAESVQLRVGETTVEMKGRIGAGASETDALDVSLIGTASDFAPIVRLMPGFETFTAEGAVTMQVSAAGAIDAPALSAWIIVADGSVSNGELPPVSDVTLAASYSTGMVSVSTATGRWQGADILAAGHAPAVLLGDRLPPAFLATLPAAREPARFDVRVTGLSPEALRPFLEPESIDQIAGRVDFAADVTATALDLDHVIADVRLDRAEVELARIPLAQTGPTRLRLANRRLDVVDWVWAGVGNHLTVNGHVLLDADAPMMDVSASGSLDLRILSAFMPGVATAGRGVVALTATGAVGDPSIEGRVVLADADLIVRDPRVAITDLSGAALLDGNRITLEGITATANGGSVAIIGGLDYSDFSVRDGAITITGRGLAFEAIDGLRTEINTDLTIAMAGGEPTIGGRVTIVRGDYRDPIRLTEQFLSTYETRVTAGGMAEASALDAIGLDLTIASAEDVIVDNNYGRVEVGSNLRVTGTVGAPVLGGRLAMREGGEVYLGGQSYTLRRGSVDFTNATRIEPDFDVALETRVRNYDITLELTGTPETLEVTLRSPGISQQDALSLLLTGQLADDTSVAYGEVARGQLLMLLSGELLSAAGRAVGLDSVQISRGLGGAASTFDLLATDSDPNARLTLAKNLSRNVELIFSQSLRNTGDITWIATYRPMRQIEFRAATDDNSSQTYEFRHELEFGGAPGAVPVVTRLPRTEIRVADVRIDGTPGFANAEIETQLRLSRGDRFDYFQWQQDRDHVAAFYHDRGFFEARISARRREEPSGLALDYDIRRGPSTTVAVEGFALPGDVLEGIHAAWTEAVFDGFLIDDVVMLVRRALVRARYLQATVDVTMDAPEGAMAKTLRVVIAAGPRFGTRRVEFTGNSALSSSALGALVESAGPDVWMEPASIDGALEAHYRSRGFLAASVTVAPARFDGATAIIAVTVNEGAAYRIGTVGVSGAAFRTADVVRKVTGLEPGAVYLPSAIEPARRAVELDYLAAGYNAVSVSALSGIDESQAIVNVVVAVGEGPQQVLQEIDVSGIGVTSSDTISRALRLEAGAPVDLSDIYAAQKRLYDTGVFRSVDISVEPIDLGPAATPGIEPVEALVSLTELPRYRFRYGVRVTDLDGPAEGLRQIRPALVLDVLNRNVFGRAISTGVAGQVESDRRLARAILSVPSLFRLPVETNLFLTRSRQTFAPDQARPFVTDRTDFTVEQQFKPRRTMAVTYGYTFGRTRTFEREVEDESVPRRDDRLNVGRVTGTYAWDTRDDPSNATRGWFHSSGVEYASRRLGSEVSFVRYLTQQYYFRTVGPHAVLASALRVGTARGFDDVVPLAERFYAGGGSSVRGFAEQGLGGADVSGSPFGGSGLIVFNQEVRFPVYRWLRGVGFVDAGNVFPTVRSLSLSNLASGAGVGLRINSPYAILRVDYGVPLTGTNRPRRGRWYFAIGQTF